MVKGFSNSQRSNGVEVWWDSGMVSSGRWFWFWFPGIVLGFVFVVYWLQRQAFCFQNGKVREAIIAYIYLLHHGGGAKNNIPPTF